MPQSIQVYCLSAFTEDEEDQVRALLEDREGSYNSDNDSDLDIELIPWDDDEDGTSEDIFQIYSENQESSEDTLFFIDRQSLEDQDFIVADGRAAQSEWYIRQTLERYGYSYSQSWYQDVTLRKLIATSGVPFGRCGAKTGYGSRGGIKSVYTKFATQQVSFERIVNTRTIQYSYTTNTQHFQQALSSRVQEVQRSSGQSTYESSSNCSQQNYTSVQNSQTSRSQSYQNQNYSVSDSQYDERSGSYQDEIAEAEYESEYKDNQAQSSISNGRYDENAYHSYQAEIADAEYDNERQQGYVKDEPYGQDDDDDNDTYNNKGDEYQTGYGDTNSKPDYDRSDSGYYEAENSYSYAGKDEGDQYTTQSYGNKYAY